MAAKSVVLTLTAKASAGVFGLRFWIMPTTTSGRPKVIRIGPRTLKGTLIVTSGVSYHVFFQFFGNPGDSVSFAFEDAAKKKVLNEPGVKITTIVPEGGARELKA